MPIEALWVRLASSRNGLPDAEAQARLAQEGPTVLTEARRLPLAVRFGRHLVHRFALLLWGGALLALVGE